SCPKGRPEPGDLSPGESWKYVGPDWIGCKLFEVPILRGVLSEETDHPFHSVVCVSGGLHL
ncbi:MAG: hypothetical protein ACK2US_03345, partial [Anaerolineae bacterium]